MKKLVKTDKQSKKGGRLTLQEHAKLKNTIRKYYDEGYSAHYTALKTGHAMNTVYSYFREWTEELIEKSDFIAQQQEAKARLVIELDKCIEIYLEQIKRLRARISKAPSLAAEAMLSNVNKNLATLRLDKAGVLITPTLDVQITQILKDKYDIDLAKLKEATDAYRS
jgi:hypothetical protein